MTTKTIALADFFNDFKDSLTQKASKQLSPAYTGDNVVKYSEWLKELKRKPFKAQENAVQALMKLLMEKGEKAGILCGDMGTGKTIMAIALAHTFSKLGKKNMLVLSPPHLVYKWKREIEQTMPEANVIVLNGADSISKLNNIRYNNNKPSVPTFYIIGRVRLRLGGEWQPACFYKKAALLAKSLKFGDKRKDLLNLLPSDASVVCCPKCGEPQQNSKKDKFIMYAPNNKRLECGSCKEQLWVSISKKQSLTKQQRIFKALCSLPTIGKIKAENILKQFGEELLSKSLEENIFQLINLMDERGDFVFSDKSAKRLERALSKAEFEINSTNYQVSEFIKRYFPKDYFDLCLVDEAHEYKSGSSAQGQSMATVATKCNKIVLLTGTLLGGYANDLFYLLHRAMPSQMVKEGFVYTQDGSLAAAEQSFQKQFGKEKEKVSFKEDAGNSESFKTSKATKRSVTISRAPGFSVAGVFRFILPYTVFVTLEDVKEENILPEYIEHPPIMVDMEPELKEINDKMNSSLQLAVDRAGFAQKKNYMGTILSAMMSITETAHLEYIVKDPFDKEKVIAHTMPIFSDMEPNNKEKELIKLCLSEREKGRKVLVYSNLTGVRDLQTRLDTLLTNVGLKVAVLRSSVATTKREDWILDKVDEDIDVLITNPKLVETGLDLLEFPSIVFMQTGYNVYTAMQAMRRSWRIGQKNHVDIFFICYSESAQQVCLSLMSEKIKVTQSSSGKMPDSGLDSLNSKGDDIQTAVAKQIFKQQQEHNLLDIA